MGNYKFVIYQDGGGKWRWKLVSTANGQIVATPGEGFSSKQSAIDNVARVKAAAEAPIVDSLDKEV